MWIKSSEELRSVTEELMEGITPEERKQMQGYLRRIARNMERAVEKHGMVEPDEPFID